MSEIEQVKVVSSAAFRSISIVSVCILLGVSLQTCKVDKEKIEVCNKACQRGMGHMKSVTAYECECEGGAFSEKKSPWVP